MARATVLHGIDMSGLSTARPGKAYEGAQYHDTDENALRTWDDTKELWEPFEYVAFTYDVTGGDSGTVGAHAISGATIPAGCVVLDGIIDVITTFTSATDAGTIALHFNAANDIVSAIAINNGGNPWDAGLHAVVPDGVASNAKKASADRTVTLTVGVEALTGGKLRGMLRCLRSTAT